MAQIIAKCKDLP